jgi:biotin carboxylase
VAPVPVDRGARPTVAIISARKPDVLAVLRAVLREHGCRVVSVAEETPWEVLLGVDVPIEADLEDWDAVVAALAEVAARDGLDAVITHIETRVPLMAFAAEQLGLGPTISLEAALNCRDKLRTRDRLQAAGLDDVPHACVHDLDAARRAARGIGLPVVVKPRDGASGQGVRLCRSLSEVEAAAALVLDRAAAPHRADGALIEGYLEGHELAIQSVTVNGTTDVVSVFDEIISPPPLFVEAGFRYPSRLSPHELDAAVGLARNALAALGFDHWVAHTQIRMTSAGPRIVEVNARVPGGRLLAMTEAVSGVNLLRAVTELSLGQPVSRAAPRAAVAAYQSIVFSQTGQLFYEPAPALALLSEPAPIVELDIEPGHFVRAVTDPDGGVYGRIVVFGDEPAVVHEDLARIQRALRLEVVPADTPGEDMRDIRQCC